MNTGDLCPLPQLVELKKQFKVRLLVDENISIGTLGETGRGIFEHYGIPVRSQLHHWLYYTLLLYERADLMLGTDSVSDEKFFPVSKSDLTLKLSVIF